MEQSVKKPQFKDNHPGPVKAHELSPERLARAQRAKVWGDKMVKEMVGNLNRNSLKNK